MANKAKYKVGDKVKVRNDLVIGRDYSGVGFVEEMCEFKNQIVTIKKIINEAVTYYRIEENNELWCWGEDMFSGKVTPEPPAKIKKHKYAVGDKVIVKKDLKLGNTYGGYCIDDKMLDYCGKAVTISKLNNDSQLSYLIEEDTHNYVWTNEMFSKRAPKVKAVATTPGATASMEMFEDFIGNCMEFIKESNETNNANMQTLVNSFTKNVETIQTSINKIANNLNARTIYDEAIIDTIKERVNKMPADELKETISSEVDSYVRKQYGNLPKRIEIKLGTKTKKIDGLFHKKFEDILKIVERGVPLMLTGPAGAGKNHTLEQVAEALDLDFYFTNAVTQEYKLTGFIDANGVYQETQFYKAFKDGGLFFLDEVDASCPEALIILNSAIANGYFDFPNGKVNVNKNFRVACAGNTYGTGADMVYVGRNALDGATLDRFVTLPFNYDESIERQLAYDNELYEFISNLRGAINSNSLRYIVSMRAIINATKLLEIDMDKMEILQNVIIKNMQIDDLNIIINKLNMSNSWAKLLKEFINARS